MTTNQKRLVLAGGSGFLGQALANYFESKGWRVVNLTRHPQRPNDFAWDARALGDWKDVLNGADAVINLTGKSVDCRYHKKNRDEILNSRTDSTRVIGEAIAQSAKPPRVWLNASTATIYQHTFGPAHDEDGFIGATPEAKDAFSVEVARAWEKALLEAPTPATRKVALRTAMVLGHGKNSVFPTLQLFTRFGLGGRMGSGAQFVSWIHQLDFCRALEWIIDHDDLSGVLNVAAPNPITNAEMMRHLRELCGIPIGLPATNWMLELGAVVLRTETELIIKSRKVIPTRLLKSGFQFHFDQMRDAFAELMSS